MSIECCACAHISLKCRIGTTKIYKYLLKAPNPTCTCSCSHQANATAACTPDRRSTNRHFLRFLSPKSCIPIIHDVTMQRSNRIHPSVISCFFQIHTTCEQMNTTLCNLLGRFTRTRHDPKWAHLHPFTPEYGAELFLPPSNRQN